MKKMLWFIAIPLSLLAFCGCNNEPVPTPDTEQVGDYFPISEDARYVYEGQGMEYAAYDVYPDYTAENIVQQRVNNGGTVLAKIVKIADGKLTETFTKEDVFYRQNFLDATDNKEEVLLMEPLVVGTTWNLADSRVRTITDTAAAVSTPAGDYTAIEVTTEGADYQTIQYYAKDIGLVKSVFISGDAEITSSLSQIETDVPLTQTVRFYYPNIDDSRVHYMDKSVDFRTNDMPGEVLAAAYKQDVPTGMGVVFSANTQINSLYLNDDGMVYIDLNSAFVSEMNAWSEFEGMILQSIADTVGNYYNAENVILTIDNAPYESGHFAFTQGEYLTVDLENTMAL